MSLGWMVCFEVFQGCYQSVGGAAVISRLDWEGFISKLIHVVVAGFNSLLNYCTGCTQFLASHGQHGSCVHHRVQTDWNSVLYDLILRVTFHHFCCILLEASHLNLAYTQGQGYPRAAVSRGVVPWEPFQTVFI